MKPKSIVLPLILVLAAVASAQFKTDLPRVDFPQEVQNMTALESRVLLNPNNFQMRHSFSMSMVSSGGLSRTVGAYTNSMTFLLRPNLRLTTSFSLVQPGISTNPGATNMLDGQFYYGAQMEFRPTENSLLQFGIQNYPAYNQYYRPWYLNPVTR